MRLVCPNCGAQYEVDDRVMPELGRDVQCSNCGHAWFHTPPQPSSAAPEDTPEPKIEIPAPAPNPASAEPEGEVEQTADAEPDPKTEPTADAGMTPDGDPDTAADEADSADAEDEAETPKPDDEPAAEAQASGDSPEEATAPSSDAEGQDQEETAAELPAHEELDEDENDAADLTAIPAAVAAAALPRKEVSEEVKQILQEEAEQELRARETDSQSLETQPDLGLDAAQDDSDEALAERIQRMKEDEEIVDEPIQEKDLKSRDMLPDIEEINSTLDAPDDAVEATIDLDPAATTAATSGNGFRRGFSLAILLAVILVCLYVLAPQIAEWFPQAQGVLEQYTAMGDSARLWLESAMQSAIEKMRGLMDSSSEG